MSNIVVENCTIFNGFDEVVERNLNVHVVAGVIRQITSSDIADSDAQRIDAGGRTLMPGLIDSHVHVVATLNDYRANAEVPDVLIALQAATIMKNMLDRGFTSLRDAGGATWTLASATESGLIEGPRLFVSARALSQTCGHGDHRGRNVLYSADTIPLRAGNVSRVVDGVDAVRKAVREQLQEGARQIKLMVSGGVSSETDPLHWTGFSLEEIRAAVEEAEAADTYVMAHAYTARAIQRAVACGVRTIEHGNLVDEATALEMADKRVYAVPTLAVYDAAATFGRLAGRSEESLARTEKVRGAGLRSLELFRDAGVKMGFGTDLSGDWHQLQGIEFAIRAKVLKPIEILRSTTSVGAEILRMEGSIGCICEGAIADLLIVDGNPLENIEILGGQGDHLSMIMKAGRIHKNRLSPAGSP